MSTDRCNSFGMQITETDTFSTSANFDGLESAINDYCTHLGINYFSYLNLRGSGPNSAPMLTSYDDEWRARYTEKSFHQYDPVALTSKRARLPFFWNHGEFLRPFLKIQRRVFHEARAFRLYAGYSIPISGPNGELAVFSIVDPDEGRLIDVIRDQGPKLQLSALHIHDAAMSLAQVSSLTDDECLSDRELECLSWTAEGKTSDEIAEIVCLSAATVNYHLNKVVLKLGAANRHHAAIIALRRGIIQ